MLLLLLLKYILFFLDRLVCSFRFPIDSSQHRPVSYLWQEGGGRGGGGGEGGVMEKEDNDWEEMIKNSLRM